MEGAARSTSCQRTRRNLLVSEREQIISRFCIRRREGKKRIITWTHRSDTEWVTATFLGKECERPGREAGVCREASQSARIQWRPRGESPALPSSRSPCLRCQIIKNCCLRPLTNQLTGKVILGLGYSDCNHYHKMTSDACAWMQVPHQRQPCCRCRY